NNATVRKSLTISGNGNTVYLGSPITVDKAGAVVALRGLVLNGQGTIDDGISIVAAAAVHIERCVIHGFTSIGIVATAPGAQVFVLDSISRDNGFAGLIINAGSSSRLTVDNSRFENHGNDGVVVASGLATISRSTSSGNVGRGLFVGSGALARISNSTFTDNAIGLFNNGGTLETRQNNTVSGNGTNVSGALTPIGGI
ncbi:MAG: hypothetical protein GEU91_23635, partial [Rhizobiales bacterium]|nr:hypothetical protein [Hyphomicrobiales bacterium]